MKRSLALVFLVVVQLQLSQAAIAAYCAHESDVAQKVHLGHHVHQHEISSSDSSTSKRIPLGTIDADCAQCHFHCLNIVAATPPAFLASKLATSGSWSDTQFVPSLPRDTLYRPPLFALA